MPELAIVPPNLWQKVQKVPGVQRQPKLQYLLSGKLKCGECGYPLVGSSYGGKKNKGGAYSCWNCRKRNNKVLRIGRDKIESAIINYLREQMQQIDIPAITEMANKKIDSQAKKGRAEEITEELARVEAAIKNITKAIESGTYSQTLLNRLSELEREREGFFNERTKLRLQQVKYQRVSVSDMEEFIGAFLQSDSFAAKRDLVEFCLNSAKVIWKKPRIVEVNSIFGSKKIPLP
jgi:site-specific DNA recombinase